MRMLLAAAALVLPATAGGAQESVWRLTPDGYGPIRIGMSRAEVTRFVGSPLQGEELTEGCIELEARRGWSDMSFMFEDGRLSRISIGGRSRVTTPRNIGTGATEAAVRRAYGPAIVAERHEYYDPPARYLTYWTVPNRRGVRFETDERRRVYAIHAGGPSIRYVEGCL